MTQEEGLASTVRAARTGQAALQPLIDEAVRRVRAAPTRRVPDLRTVRRAVSRGCRDLGAGDMVRLADGLLRSEEVPRWFVYELFAEHPAAMAALDLGILERLGEGMQSWVEVDPFACFLSGVAWREGRITDRDIHRWAADPDRWWRRAALVSTVPLNLRSRGGTGDVRRTLRVCDLLRADRDDMVVKAMSWALRGLVPHDPGEVREYIDRYPDQLAPRVLREVTSKLETGLKSGRARR